MTRAPVIRKRLPRTLAEFQNDVNQYAKNVLLTVPFETDGDGHPKLATIHEQIISAWAAGYAARAEERTR